MIAFQSFDGLSGLERVDVDVDVVDAIIAGVRSEASQLIDVLFREEKSTFDRIEGNADAAKDWIQSFQNRRGAKIFLSCWSDQEHQ